MAQVYCKSKPLACKRNHCLLVVAFSFLLGTLSLFHLHVGPWLWCVVAIGLALFFCRHRTLSLILCAFAFGALHAQAAFDVPLPPPGEYEVTATVSGGITLRSDQRISFTITDVLLDGEATEGKARVSLYYGEELPHLFDGARIRFAGRVYHPSSKNGPSHFDSQLWMRQEGLAFGVAAHKDVWIENTPVTAPVTDWAYRVRQAFQRWYERVMGENARVAMALLFGQRDGLSDAEYKAFQDLGVAHVMSVSGLHVSLLGGMLYGLLARIGTSKKVSLCLLAVVLAAYCAVTGFSAAANRAAVMFVFALMSRLCHRRPERMTTLAASMLVVLLLNPLHAFSAGFVLSFSAMLGICLYTRLFGRLFDRLWPSARVRRPKQHPVLIWKQRIRRSIRETLTLSLAAQLGVLLPTAVYFHQLPLYGVLLNMLIVPFVSVVLVPLYALTLPVSLFPLLGPVCGALASVATDALLWLVQLLARLPYAAIRVASPPFVLCIGIGFALILLSRRLPGSLRRRVHAAALVCVVAVGAAWMQRPAELRYIQLSVGKADCALLLDGRQTILIDTGVDGLDVLDVLLAENRNVDALILTHLHIDHIGGVQTLLDNGIDIGHVYLPIGAENQRVDDAHRQLCAKLRRLGIPVSELASGDELRYNRCAVRVLWPERETLRCQQDANEYPLVLSIDLDGYRLLHMSDLPGSYETLAAIPADVLKVAHHAASAAPAISF